MLAERSNRYTNLVPVPWTPNTVTVAFSPTSPRRATGRAAGLRHAHGATTRVGLGAYRRQRGERLGSVAVLGQIG